MTSKFPACTDVEVPDADAQLDAGAKAALQELGAALATNDPARLAPLLAARVKIGKASLSATDATAKVTKAGPQAIVGFEPSEHFDTAANIMRCTWTLSTAPIKAGLEVFTGSGYGDTRVAKLSKVDGEWRIFAFEIVDYGEP